MDAPLRKRCSPLRKNPLSESNLSDLKPNGCATWSRASPWVDRTVNSTLYRYGSFMPCHSRGRSTCNMRSTDTGRIGGIDTRLDSDATTTWGALSIRVSTMTVRGFAPSLTSFADTRTAADFESMVAPAYNPGPP